MTRGFICLVIMGVPTLLWILRAVFTGEWQVLVFCGLLFLVGCAFGAFIQYDGERL